MLFSNTSNFCNNSYALAYSYLYKLSDKEHKIKTQKIFYRSLKLSIVKKQPNDISSIYLYRLMIDKEKLTYQVKPRNGDMCNGKRNHIGDQALFYQKTTKISTYCKYRCKDTTNKHEFALLRL